MPASPSPSSSSSHEAPHYRSSSAAGAPAVIVPASSSSAPHGGRPLPRAAGMATMRGGQATMRGGARAYYPVTPLQLSTSVMGGRTTRHGRARLQESLHHHRHGCSSWR